MSRTINKEIEIQVLNYIRNHAPEIYINNGSSRYVFEINGALASILLPIFADDCRINESWLCRNTVLKMSVGVGAMTQTRREQEVFDEYGSNYLAEIFASGITIMVCERVDIEECMDDLEDLNKDDFYDMCEDYGIQDADSIWKVLCFLEKKNGYTADNAQLGYSVIDGRPVSYDYGFVCNDDFDCRSSQISCISIGSIVQGITEESSDVDKKLYVLQQFYFGILIKIIERQLDSPTNFKKLDNVISNRRYKILSLVI